ncbi:SpoIIE family protein phosphatase [Nonomuraea sp. NN258]|uniref:SpoIIE family protein phosphatase n=1 Tax=Nonomuraea antri TaxID=2730852 RepID=UPI001568AA8C|nr:SpoIIE family protein phosphatase [Nonomuraea antri]NRQ33914.1 SpoIIE family protein phosphatase [Nonomuraea antri]
MAHDVHAFGLTGRLSAADGRLLMLKSISCNECQGYDDAPDPVGRRQPGGILPRRRPAGSGYDMNADLRSGMEATFATGGTMGAIMRDHVWEETPLGAVHTWPQSLRSSVSICLTSRFPMIIYWGPDLTVLYNDAYAPILATKHPWALGRPAHECWAEIWDVIEPMLSQVLHRGRATYSDDLLLILHRSGFPEECYFTFSFSPIRDETGGVGGVFCAVTETTQQVISARRLATLRALGERTATVDAAADACAHAAQVFARNTNDVPFALLYLLDEDGQHARLAGSSGLAPGGGLSPPALRLQVSAEEVCPWPLAATLAGEIEVACSGEELDALAREGFDPPAGAVLLPIAGATGEQPAGVLVAGTPGGQAAAEDVRAFLRIAAAQISAAIADATARAAERRRTEQLAALNQAKTTFFSNISHEFRTPLTLMLGPLDDVLADPAGPRPADRELVEMSRRNALRLLKLVNTLLDFSRAEAGPLHPRLEPVDLGAMTAELASLFQTAVERGGLRLTVDCRPLPRPVPVDAEMWEKIILNLLSNAFKFTLDGEITVTVDHAGDWARVRVSDTGVGIPSQELARLFDRFHRVAGTRARSEEGSGIGLSLVHELIQRHGGTIEVDSTTDVGTTFTMLLPYGTTAATAAAASPSPGPERSAAYLQEALSWAPPAPTAPEEQPAEVLIVDDNADMREHLVRTLAPHWRVQVVSDGRAALKVVGRAAPELVLTDVMMPHLDGFGLLKALRAADATRHLPVIMVSARAGQEATLEGLDAGADDYLIKPFTAAELIARVRTHLNTARQRRRAAERIQVLSHVTQQLNSSLDPARIGRILSDNLVPSYARGCAVWLHDEPAALPLLLHVSADDALDATALRRPLAADGLPQTGQLALALGHHDRIIGTVILADPTPAASHPADRPFLADLVNRAALALDNAARYRREHRIALHLQRSLLPAALPAVNGIDLASRYVAGAAGSKVGGDWYDALVLPDGRLALTIGDVMGRGVQAAALMGQLRTVIRAYALEGIPAAPLLERLNTFLDGSGQRQFTTMCYALFDPASRHLQMANAGHLPPLLVPATGPVSLLPIYHGLALGVDAAYDYSSQDFTLPPGSTLLLYTDGLVESRDQLLGDRLNQLCEALSGQRDHDAAAVCGTAMTAMVTGSSDDDIALLAMHHTQRSR